MATGGMKADAERRTCDLYGSLLFPEVFAAVSWGEEALLLFRPFFAYIRAK
jgi:hypothetical protein